MKREIISCDVCNTVVDGPHIDKPRYGETAVAVPAGSELDVFHTIDTCEDCSGWDKFDGNVTLVYGGSEVFADGLIEISEMDLLMVVVNDNSRMVTTAYSTNLLGGERRSLVDSLDEAARHSWKVELDNNPRYGNKA